MFLCGFLSRRAYFRSGVFGVISVIGYAVPIFRKRTFCIRHRHGGTVAGTGFRFFPGLSYEADSNDCGGVLTIGTRN